MPFSVPYKKDARKQVSDHKGNINQISFYSISQKFKICIPHSLEQMLQFLDVQGLQKARSQ